MAPRFGIEDLLLGGGAAAPSAPAVGDGPQFGLRGGGAVAPATSAAPSWGVSGFAPAAGSSVRGLKLNAADLRQAIADLTARLSRSKAGASGFGRPQDWQAAQLRGALQQRDPTAESFVSGVQQQDPQTMAFVKGLQSGDPDTLAFVDALRKRGLA